MFAAGIGASPVWALGAMSGTSLDGVDAAMILTDGEAVVEFGPTAYRPYTEAERCVLRAALGRWPGDRCVAEAAEVVETAHAEVLSRFTGVDVVGFHGQTLAHDPAGRRTHQAGNGDLLAKVLGVPVVWDFRTADVTMGGQGAPLAPFYHFALARRMGARVGFLNLGGVGNLTLADPEFARPDLEGALIAFDTGPANAPIDDLMRARFNLGYDAEGAVAARGGVAGEVVAAALAAEFTRRAPPKSLDRGDFADLMAAVEALPDADAVATATAVAAATAAAGVAFLAEPPGRLLVCGGGRRNRVLMAHLAAALPEVRVEAVEAAGFDGDMLEAQAFAHLAVRVARGMATSCRGTTGVAAAVGGGRIARPLGAARRA